MSDAPTPRIAAIGSCRIDHPLKSARDEAVFDFRLCRGHGFTHSAPEALQRLRWLRGDVTFPDYLRGIALSSSAAAPAALNADIAVVEISTLRYVLFDGYILQLNYLKEALVKTPELWDIWRTHATETDREARLAELGKTVSFHTIPTALRQILERAVMQVQDIDALRADLRALRDLLPENVLIVTHCMADDAHPAMETRRHVVTAVAAACAAEGLRCFDPSPHAAAFGRARAFVDQSRDINHYTEAFAAHLGTLLAQELGLPQQKNSSKRRIVLLTRALKEEDVLKDPARAQEAAQALLSLDPHARFARKTAARAAMLLGNWAEACEQWSHLAALDPDNDDAAQEAARAALRSGNAAAARTWLASVSDPVLRAEILLAHGDAGGATTALAHHIAPPDTSGNPWLEAVFCRAAQLDDCRTKLCEAALYRAIDAASLEAEIDNIRLARFIAEGDNDLSMRVRAVLTASIGNATACNDMARLDALLALDAAFCDVALQAAENCAARGDTLHATRLVAHGLIPKQNEAVLAHAHRLAKTLEKQLQQQMRADPDTATALALLTLDPTHVAALRIACFASDTPANVRAIHLDALARTSSSAPALICRQSLLALENGCSDIARQGYAALKTAKADVPRLGALAQKISRALMTKLKEAEKAGPHHLIAAADAVLSHDPANTNALTRATRGLMRARAWRRALPYAQQLAALSPDNNRIRELAELCESRARAEA